MSKSKKAVANIVDRVIGEHNPAVMVTAIDQIVFPDLPDVKRGKPSTGLSIRAIIRKGLSEGRTTASIAAVVKEHFPDSAAAEKSSKHIGFYRSEMKKAGELDHLTER